MIEPVEFFESPDKLFERRAIEDRFKAGREILGGGSDEFWLARAAARVDAAALRNAADIGPQQGFIQPTTDFPAVLALASLDGANGFRLDGVGRKDHSGFSVSSAGDINGDGFDDVIIGAPGPYLRDVLAGESYVVFGKAGGFAASLDLAALDGRNGFRLEGFSDLLYDGWSVSSAGDINGDGFDDIIIGAIGKYLRSIVSGDCYVVFGKASAFDASLDLMTLDGDNGFRIDGVNMGDQAGHSVSSAGDFNGDGFDDLIIGAKDASGGGTYDGETYIVYGKAGGFRSSFDLEDTESGEDGFFIVGPFGSLGWSVSDAGDVNGDGFDDIVIGNPNAYPPDRQMAGESYVVFGSDDTFAGGFDVATLDGSNGFRIEGASRSDFSGASVSGAGDVNGDGYADIIIGAAQAPESFSTTGRSYIVLGKADGFDASIDLLSFTGPVLEGIAEGDESGWSVSGAGDVNGDGFDDVIVGTFGSYYGDRTSDSYVVFGSAHGVPTMNFAELDGSNGFSLNGVDTYDDGSGQAVSGAGDVNGDGFDDIIIGAPRAGNGNSYPGESYVVFGRAPTTAVNRVGGNADQEIRGGDFNDTLKGLGGADTLAGGDGEDKLRGGGGKDDFVLASGKARDADEITDFAPGRDRIALDSAVFGLPEGALSAGRFVVGNAAGDANDRLIYNDANGKLFFDPDGSGAQAKVRIATLTDAPTLESADFIVI